MLKRSVATITLFLGSSVLASAADLPSLTVAPLTSPEPAYNWTGFYAGANVGFGTDRYTFPYGFQGPGVAFAPGRGTIVSSGPIGGVQIGYNYQTPWKVVLGIDVEAEGRASADICTLSRPSRRATSRRRSTSMGLFAPASDTRSTGSSFSIMSWSI
jgi:opacity protein-like surface antigen